MKSTLLIYLIILASTLTYSQTKCSISSLENQKAQIKQQIENLTDSIKKIDIKIAIVKSETFLKRINDSTIKGIARKGAKLKKDSYVFADIITTFEEDKEVIILDFENGYFEICQNSLCGFLNEIWLVNSISISDFIKSKKTEQKIRIQKDKNSSNNTSSLKILNNDTTEKTTKKRINYRTYYRGPRGGCYYINSKGNKSYVDRSLCN